MVFAEIKITIKVNEDQLTTAQQLQANKADTDIMLDHPLDKGINRLVHALGDNALIHHFEYLEEGKRAVDIKVSS